MSNSTLHPLGSQLIRATIARFEADRQEAIATLQVYLNAGVGVGDHPHIVEEIVTATKNLAAAEEALDSLTRNFLKNNEEEGDE